jgi:hypothetical protein
MAKRKKRRPRRCRICKKSPVWRGGDVKDPGPFCKRCYHKHISRGRKNGRDVDETIQFYEDYSWHPLVEAYGFLLSPAQRIRELSLYALDATADTDELRLTPIELIRNFPLDAIVEIEADPFVLTPIELIGEFPFDADG